MSKYYFHFTSDKLRNGSPIPPVGEWLVFPGKPIICEQGLHASEHPFDALQYAPGNNLHIVELRGITDKHLDKVVAKERKIVTSIDAEDLLYRCSRKFALDVIHLWNPPQIVLDYLKTGNKSIRKAAGDAAWAAAEDAAGAATGAAAGAAARAAAWAAAGAVAWSAAWAAARAATGAAAWSAAWAAAGVAQREYFLNEVKEEFRKQAHFSFGE